MKFVNDLAKRPSLLTIMVKQELLSAEQLQHGAVGQLDHVQSLRQDLEGSARHQVLRRRVQVYLPQVKHTFTCLQLFEIVVILLVFRQSLQKSIESTICEP